MNTKQAFLALSLVFGSLLNGCAPSREEVFGTGSRSGLIPFEHYEPDTWNVTARTITVVIEPDATPQISVANTRCVYQFRVGDSIAYVRQPMIGSFEIRYIPQGWCSHLITSRELQSMYSYPMRYRIYSDGGVQSRIINILD